MAVKGWDQLKDAALAEHALLVRAIHNRLRLGLSISGLGWCAWHIRQIAEAAQGHIEGIITYENHEFYKLCEVLQDCINRGRKGS